MINKDDWTSERTELGTSYKWYNKVSYVQNEYDDDDIYDACAFQYLHPNGHPAQDGVSVCRWIKGDYN